MLDSALVRFCSVDCRLFETAVSDCSDDPTVARSPAIVASAVVTLVSAACALAWLVRLVPLTASVVVSALLMVTES